MDLPKSQSLWNYCKKSLHALPRFDIHFIRCGKTKMEYQTFGHLKWKKGKCSGAQLEAGTDGNAFGRGIFRGGYQLLATS